MARKQQPLDRVEGFLQVGHNAHGEVVLNIPNLTVDAHGRSHLVFTPRQARHLARVLVHKARAAEQLLRLGDATPDAP